MKIEKATPPNYAMIARVFGGSAIENACFTYGDTCYNPKGGELSPDLIAHEEQHVKQQENPAAWWDQYLVDVRFRLEQEVEAYQAQYRYAVDHYDRGTRRRLLLRISKDLSGPLYGKIVDRETAQKLIQGKLEVEIV